MSFAKDIIWGKRTVTSRLEFKYAMLRGEFAIIIMSVGLFYSILDSTNDVFVFLPWYAVMITLCITAMIFNRMQYYTVATIIMLFIVNFLIFNFADVDHPSGGVFFYFATTCMAGLILLSYYRSRLGLFFALLPIPLGFVAYFFDFNLAPKPLYEQNMITINFLANFTISLLAIVFMLRFLINRNKESEQSLVEQNNLLEKANKELDHFVYSVSHDLRAPLSSILGLTNVYQLATSEKEKAEMVKMINERAQSLDNFIKEVLDYSRNARTELRMQPVNVRELVEECLKGIGFIHGAESVTVTINVDAKLVVSTDRERIKVVLNNIIGNAFYYRDVNKEKPAIKIESSLTNGQWVIAVSDNGIGIRSEHLARIFEMFYKAHDRAHGTGLGLYIVKETLQRLNGDIRVESEFERGTTFTIQIGILNVDD